VSRRNDDRDMKRRMSEREQDALLRGPLAGFVSELESLASDVPAPSPALYALLQEGLEPDPAMVPALPRVRHRRAWLVPVPLTALVLAGTVGAASADVLPDSAQRVVSDTVASFTPIHFPKPAAKQHHKPVVTPTEDPETAVPRATGRPTSLPEPALSHRAPEATAHPTPHSTGSHRGRPEEPHRGRPSLTPSPAPEATDNEHRNGLNGNREDHGNRG